MVTIAPVVQHSSVHFALQASQPVNPENPENPKRNGAWCAGGGSAVVTIAPVVQRAGVHFAALGLPGMLNAGGAVTACSLAPADAWAQSERHAAPCLLLVSLLLPSSPLALVLQSPGCLTALSGLLTPTCAACHTCGRVWHGLERAVIGR